MEKTNDVIDTTNTVYVSATNDLDNPINDSDSAAAESKTTLTDTTNPDSAKADRNNQARTNTLTEQDKKYLQGKPTRMEVANYVNSLMEQHWAPRLIHQTQLGIMILQGILLKKNVCTPDELKSLTEEFVKEYETRQANQVDIMAQIDVLLNSPFTSNLDKELLVKVQNILNGKVAPTSNKLEELIESLSKTSLTVVEPIVKELNILKASILRTNMGN